MTRGPADGPSRVRRSACQARSRRCREVHFSGHSSGSCRVAISRSTASCDSSEPDIPAITRASRRGPPAPGAAPEAPAGARPFPQCPLSPPTPVSSREGPSGGRAGRTGRPGPARAPRSRAHPEPPRRVDRSRSALDRASHAPRSGAGGCGDAAASTSRRRFVRRATRAGCPSLPCVAATAPRLRCPSPRSSPVRSPRPPAP